MVLHQGGSWFIYCPQRKERGGCLRKFVTPTFTVQARADKFKTNGCLKFHMQE